MLAATTAFNQDISLWDTSQVTTMQSMFYDATVFNQPIGLWDTSKVTTMLTMFINAAAFDGDISFWDVGEVTNMANMFNSATAFNQDISPWNIVSVVTMQNMLNGATAFSHTLCWDTTGITIIDMFVSSGGSFGAALTDSNFQTACTDWVSDPSTATIAYCTIEFWDTSAVTDMSNAFKDAGTFNDDISTWDVSSVTRMESVSNESMTWCLAASRLVIEKKRSAVTKKLDRMRWADYS
jgi:surface protein